MSRHPLPAGGAVTEIDAHCSPIVACPQSKLLSEHGKAIDAAHSKLRDHEVQIAQLELQGGHCLTRLERVEQASHENQRILVKVDGGLAHVEQALKTVSTTAEATHGLVSNHIADALAKDEKASQSRLAHEETQQKRLIRLVGAATAILVVATLIHSSVTGQSIWSILGAWLQ
jgi:hypothetical protein